MREKETMSKCLNCGESFPPVRWWQWLTRLGTAPLVHDPKGPDGEACWKLLCEHMGIKNPPPRPL